MSSSMINLKKDTTIKIYAGSKMSERTNVKRQTGGRLDWET